MYVRRNSGCLIEKGKKGAAFEVAIKALAGPRNHNYSRALSAHTSSYRFRIKTARFRSRW